MSDWISRSKPYTGSDGKTYYTANTLYKGARAMKKARAKAKADYRNYLKGLKAIS